jgi:hypothetical protein
MQKHHNGQRQVRLQTLRVRKIGSNVLSEKYTYPVPVEDYHRDLALFIAHTGFANIRNTRNRVDADFIPVFQSPSALCRCLAQMPTDEHTCGFIVSSLEMAWRLVDQRSLLKGNELWYILEEAHFILYMHKSGLSSSTYSILSDPDTVGCHTLTFQPEPISIAWDTFLTKQLDKDITSLHIFNSLCIMIPSYITHHGLTRHSVVNRLAKLRRSRETEVSMCT